LLPGVGGKGSAKLWEKFSSELAKSQAGAARNDESSASRPSPRLAIALMGCAAGVPKKAAVAWAQFSATIAQLEIEPICRQPARMIQLVLDAGYEDYLEDTFANFRNRLEDLQQLANFALQFSGTTDFLTQLSLLSNLEAEEDQVAATDDERVRLSTIHQAKGLEFDVVFVIMLCDGLFPSARSLESLEGEEEERRLFYVAITRARQELYLSYPLIRLTQGYGGDMMQQRSRFLNEISAELLDEWNLKPFNPYG
jgi:DNA helicase-2/ATP-dependent DNA helicase PcrA